MKRELVLTPKFKRVFRKFVKHDKKLQNSIEETLLLMQEDVFSSSLNTHKLSGTLENLRACTCGYDCRIVFSLEKITGGEVIVLFDIGKHDEVY